jgi:phospholipase D
VKSLRNAGCKLILAAAVLVGPARGDRLDPIKPVAPGPGLAAYFNPGDDIQGQIRKAIAAAKTEILVNEYAITDSLIATDLVEAFKRRHVYVALLLDPSPAVRNYQAPEYFVMNDLPVLLVQGTGYNNNKYMVIDRQTVLTGSYDLTNAAAKKNGENLLVVSDAGIASAYYNHWVATAAKALPAPPPKKD